MHDEIFNEANFPELMFNAIAIETIERGWITKDQTGELCEAIQYQMLEIAQEG